MDERKRDYLVYDKRLNEYIASKDAITRTAFGEWWRKNKSKIDGRNIRLYEVLSEKEVKALGLNPWSFANMSDGGFAIPVKKTTLRCSRN